MPKKTDAIIESVYNEYWQHTQDLSFIKDINGVYICVSAPFAKMVGYSHPDQVTGKTDLEIFNDTELAKKYRTDDEQILSSGIPLENYVEPIIPHFGAPQYALTSKYILRDEDGNAVGILGLGRNVTLEYKAREIYEHQLRDLFNLPNDSSAAVLFDISSWRVVDARFRDENNHIVSRYSSINDYFQNAAASVVSDQKVVSFFQGLSKDFFEKEYVSGKRNRSFDYIRRMPDDSERWVREEFHYLIDPTNGSLSLIVVLRDIDKIKREYSQLKHAAERDSITELLNHDATVKKINDFIVGSKGTHALFMIDIDNFKEINDTFGHQYGDTILANVADAIRGAFRSSDIAGRLGGDEFMALMKDIHSIKTVQQKAEELTSALQFFSDDTNHSLQITSSIGITLFESNEQDFETLYRQADTALYISKNKGKNRYTFYDNSTKFQLCDPSVPSMENVTPIQLRTLLDYMDGGIILAEVTDDIKITYVSPSIYKSFGHRKNEFSSPKGNIMSFILPQDYPGFRETVFNAAASDDVFDYSYRINLDKEIKWCRIRAKRIPEQVDGIHRIVSVITDITDLKKSNQNFTEVNEEDYLTGLLNKQTFYHHVRKILNANPNKKYALIRFDINRFKIYNDVCGTLSGDKLLQAIGAEIQSLKDYICLGSRLESDHFMVLVHDNKQTIQFLKDKLKRWLAEYPSDFRLSFTVGVYNIADPSMDVSSMCDRALIALNSVKSPFDTKSAYFDNSMWEILIKEQRLLEDIDKAIENEEFLLYFQPQVNYENGHITGAEALVRWDHPQLGLLYPNSFIPLLEQNGLITRMDEYIWERCCKYIKEWTDKYSSAKELSISVSVNVSRLDIYDSKLCEKLQNLLKKYSLPTSALRLEITESAYMEHPQQLIDMVNDLQRAGFIIEMDDFGSGYSSLNTLKDVAIDILKLDMKFLADCSDRSRSGNILSSVIRMAHWLKLPVIAEGVESKTQADYLKSLGCIYMQGYYFAKPMPASEFERIVAEDAVSSINRYRDTSVEGMAAFWDSSAQTALLFNSFVGGAAIIEYRNGIIEVTRANDNYYETLGTTRENYMPLHTNLLGRFDEENQAIMIAAVNKAIDTGEECYFELSSIPSQKVSSIWTGNRLRLLVKNIDSAILYISVENITQRKLLEQEREAEAGRSRLIMESTGSSFFDYDYLTDTLNYQLYIKDKGVEHRIIHNCTADSFRSKILHPESVEMLRDLILKRDYAAADKEIEFLADLWGKGMQWCRIRYSVIKNERGKICRLVGQADDIQDVKDRTALSEAVRHRLNTNTQGYIFNDDMVNQIFSLFYGSSNIESAINTTMSILGEYFNLNSVYIFEEDSTHTAMSKTFEWRASDFKLPKELLRTISYSRIGGRDEFIGLFDSNWTLFCPDADSVPNELASVLKLQNIKSMLQCAIRDNGTFCGIIGFNEYSQDRHWTDEQIGTLIFISRIVASFLLKLRASDNMDFSADFKAALDDNSEYIYIINPETYEIIYTNKAIQLSSGNDFIGEHCYESFIRRETPCPQCPVLHLNESNKMRLTEIKRYDGMVLLSHASPLRWNGQDMAMLSCVDITSSKKAEHELFTEKQKNQLLLSATNISTWIFDIKSDVIIPSRSNTPHYTANVPIENGYRGVIKLGIISEESLNDFIELHLKIKSGAESASALIHFLPEKGPAEWVRVVYTTIFDENGLPESAIAIGHDITSQKNNQK